MRLTIPITGTVLTEGKYRDGTLTGDATDPIRPITLDLGNVSCNTVDVDLENEVMVIEVDPAENIAEPTGEYDAEGEPMYHKGRPATPEEKQGFLQHARGLVEGHTKDELYALSKCPRLKRPKTTA